MGNASNDTVKLPVLSPNLKYGWEKRQRYSTCSCTCTWRCTVHMYMYTCTCTCVYWLKSNVLTGLSAEHLIQYHQKRGHRSGLGTDSQLRANLIKLHKLIHKCLITCIHNTGMHNSKGKHLLQHVIIINKHVFQYMNHAVMILVHGLTKLMKAYSHNVHMTAATIHTRIVYNVLYIQPV